MKNIIINARSTVQMKEALRQVAFAAGTTSSGYINQLLEQDEKIAAELKKQKHVKGKSRRQLLAH